MAYPLSFLRFALWSFGDPFGIVLLAKATIREGGTDHEQKENYHPLAAGILTGAMLTTTAEAADYVKARLAEPPIYYNGARIECRAYVIEEQNHIRLADLCGALGVEAYWDSGTHSVYLGERLALGGTVILPADGSRFVPKTGDKILCDDGTTYEITDVSRWDANLFSAGPLPELLAWDGTLALLEPEARRSTVSGDDYLYLRNLYETRWMTLALLSGSPTVRASIPEEVEPNFFWPWRESELAKQLTVRPNAIYSAEAWDVYKNGAYLRTEYSVYIQ